MSETKIKSIVKLVNKELNAGLKFRGPSELYNAAKWLIKAGGKRLRPVLALLSCEAVGGKKENALPFAVALELVHNFTLIHDDIMDKDEFRRGVKTTHIVFGESTAINAGDALFALAFETLSSLEIDDKKVKELVAEFSKTIRELAEGQQLDLNFEKRKVVTPKEYFKMVELKTSRLFELATKGGAVIGNGSKAQIEALAQYGKYLGLGFQIWDDFLGVAGDPKKTGKPVGNDLRTGKKTLIIAHGISKLKGKDRKYLLKILGDEKATKVEVERAIELLKEISSLDYARDVAITFASRAKQALNAISASEAKAALELIADYSVGRDR
ncbi:MAG: polyprenyl synthetase family protein [Candidatus Thermoplasmatota archaeon]|nr:polyprenyl synthetase family protein [Candidatus Thermoplasmatota archaeon]